MTGGDSDSPSDGTGRFKRTPLADSDSSRLAHADRDRRNLIDELARIRRRLTTITDRGRAAFFDEDDETNFLAVQAILINFDDASSRRIPEQVKSRFPDIPWGGISGMRNVLAHDYRSAQKDLIWQVATNELPRLLDELLADDVL